MSEAWRVCTLGDFVTLKRGYDLPLGSRRSGAVPIISSSGSSGLHDKPKVRAPGVVTGRYGTLGEVFYVTEDFWPLNTTLYVQDFKGNNPRFTSYLLRTLHFAHHNDKSSIPGVNRNDLHRLRVSVPTAVTEQRVIAEVLGNLDDKVELNRQMNRTLEAKAQALFKSWFIDFDPVVAKAAGRQPFGMNAETAALFPSCFVESEAGPTPEGWKVSRIGDEVRVVGGSTPSTGHETFWQNGTIRWITPRDLSKLENPVVVDTERRITEEGLKEISSGLLPVGTVLLSSRAPIGYLAVTAIPVAINQGFIALVCDRSLPSLYVLQWVRESLEEIVSRAGGTTFAEISKANFRPISVLVPGEKVLETFSETATPLYDRITANIQESATLAALRDTLLPKLMSGEIRLRDADNAVGSAI